MRKNLQFLLSVILMLFCILDGWTLIARAEQELVENRSTFEDQGQMTVTIYNNNLALVKDLRRVCFPKGESLLALGDVSGSMMPETALLRSSSASGTFRVIEQSFDSDLLTPQKLLEKYIGRTVEIIRVHPQNGTESREEARVLAVNGGVVLQMGDHIETGIPGRLIYPDVPDNLRDRPTLVVQVASDRAGERDMELSYLTSGLSWRADYVAELNAADDRVDLSGWVTLTNQSSTEYRNAQVQLVAGDIHRVSTFREMDGYNARALKATSAAPQMAEESLFDYHLYTLDRLTTLRENQAKQVALITTTDVPAIKEYVLRGGEYYYRGRYGTLGEKLPVAVFLEFAKREKDGFGMPLPKGIMRVYKRDSAGRTQFVGEDHVDHTPRNEKIRLRLGNAFNVTAKRVQTDFKKLVAGEKETLIETAYRIDLKNTKTEPVTVKIEESLPGDWQIVQENHPHHKQDANTAVWKIPVPAAGKATLTYRARVRF
jgi:hypothetical protein